MDYAEKIAELREAIQSNETEDFNKNEIYYWEIRRELILQREQNLRLEKELQEANSKIFYLNQELETTKSHLTKSEFRLKLTLKKSSTLEEKLKEINDSYTNLKLEEEMKLSEIQILNQNIQKLAHENHQLTRDIEDHKDRLKYTKAFQDELENRQMKINTIIKKNKENCEQLEKEHKILEELSQRLEKIDSFKNLSESLARNNEKLKQANSELKNSLVESSAKFDKLSNLLKNQDPKNQDIIEKIKYLQWEVHCKYLQQKNFNNEKILSGLTATLNSEIEANNQLLLQIEKYEEKIKELEEKLDIKSIKKENLEIISIE